MHTLVKEIEKKLMARTQLPKCMAYVQKFFEASGVYRDALVSQFSVVSVDTDPIEPLRVLLTPAVPWAFIDVICQSAIGIAKEWADQRIRKGMSEAAIVQNEALRARQDSGVARQHEGFAWVRLAILSMGSCPRTHLSPTIGLPRLTYSALRCKTTPEQRRPR